MTITPISAFSSGLEFWYARDLQKLLDYDEWRNFLNVIEKAKMACENSGQNIGDHFVDVTKMVQLGSGSEREISKIETTMIYLRMASPNMLNVRSPLDMLIN